MFAEKNLKKFIKSIGIVSGETDFEIKPEYLNDLQPQVYVLRDKNQNPLWRIRIISERLNALQTEEKVCLLLEQSNVKCFYPKVYQRYQNIPQIGDILITDYKNGFSIDKCNSDLSENDHNIIVSQLCENLREIHSVTSREFSDFSSFSSDNWFDFFKYKLDKHLREAQNNQLLSDEEIHNILYLLLKEQEIFMLNYGSLIHFDIKPANIIWNPDERKIYLIDFEMSRFGDPFMEFTKGKFTSLLFNNSVYEDKIWIPLVEQYFSQTYDQIFSSRKAGWYLFYHYTAHCNYQLKTLGKIYNSVFKEFQTYKNLILE